MAEPAGELCQRCGLCCDGSLFARTPLAPGESELLRAKGIEPARDAALAQPCPALTGLRCAIYSERPASCRRYECLLLRALLEGEVDLDEALAVVADTRARLLAKPPAESAELAVLLDRRFRGTAPR